jgi:hypothetical protein
MSKIPDYTALNRSIPQVSGQIDTRGVGANIGQGLLDIAKVTSGIHQKKAEKEFSDADTEMYTHLVSSVNSFDEDDDHETMRTRFDADVTGKLGEVAAKITSPEQRNAFVNKYKKETAKYGEQVSNQAWGKKVDFEKSSLIDQLNGVRDAALRDKSPEALSLANEKFSNAISSSRGLNYISEVEATNLQKSMRDETAKAYVGMLPLEKRLGALKQLKDKLPPEELKVMKDGINEELRVTKAQNQVDEYLEADMDRSAAMKDIGKKYKKDPDLRKEVEARFSYAFDKQEKAVVEEQSELFDKYFLPVRAGESTVEDIPREDLERMSPSQQNSLFSAQSTSVSKAKTPFNIGAEDRLNSLVQERRFQEARKFFVENAGGMSDSQQKMWSKMTVDGITPDNKSLFTTTQTINNKVPGYSKDRKAELSEAVTEWHLDYQEKEGFAPDDKTRNEQIDRLIMQYDTNWLYGVGTKPVFEMSEKEKKGILANAKEEDPDTFNDVTEYFKAMNIQPDHAQYMEAYTLMRDKRRAQ